MPFVVGESVGPYRITERLGTGGMATVWKAYHPALDRYVALKVLHPSFKEDPNFTARFQREAKIVAKLIHPHIVPIYDFSEHEGMSYLVMRFIHGHTLKALLKEGPLSLDRILRIIKPAGDALAYAHQEGVLHRDVKPSNFIITPDADVFLTDFGLARMAQSTESTMSRDMLMGTPQYISPEQARGEELDPRTDIYSLGVVLFEMLTGKVPYDADTPYAVIHDHIFSPLPLPSQFKPGILEPVERTVLKALSKDRNDRFDSVPEMISALEEAALAEGAEIEGEAEPAPVPEVRGEEPVEEVEPVELVEEAPPPSRWRSRRFVWSIAGVGALLTLCLCCFLFVVLTGKVGPRPLRRLQQTVTAAPDDYGARVQLARAYLGQGNIEQAIIQYEAALQIDPQAVEAYIGLGNVHLKERDAEPALEVYRQALEIEPDNVQAHLGMGNAFFLLDDYDNAALHYQRVIELEPDLPEPHARVGIQHVLRGQMERAVTECERALELDPELAEGHFCMGLYYAEQGATERARQEFQVVVDTAPGMLEEQARRQLDRLD